MAYELKMPQLGLTMEEGTVSKWIKKEGDAVKVGDVIVEITTDKLTNEVISETEGTLLKIVAQEGDDIPVKGLLAYIGQPGEMSGCTCCCSSHSSCSITRCGARQEGCWRHQHHRHRRRARRLRGCYPCGTAGRQGHRH